jgi:UDP-N-acetylmuramoyl-tripeptide--D-alanyl-D-alanine ligase
MGADSPGDIKHLAKIFKPGVGVVLEVLPVHLALFGNVEAVAKEKAELVKAIPKSGNVYLNYDNPVVRGMNKLTSAKVTYFGSSQACDELDFCASNIHSGLDGLNFDLTYKGVNHKVSASLYGEQMIYPLMASIAVSVGEGIELNIVLKDVKKLKPFKGRMNVIKGMNGSTIIDDSYNSNPESAIKSLDFLSHQKGRRIALLGSMNELGDYEEEGHRFVGEKAAESADVIFTVGSSAEKYLAQAALSSGFVGDNLKTFKTAEQLGEYLKTFVSNGDVILAKGSQNNVRMEKAVIKIMATPDRSAEVLVRQSDFWK